MPPRPHISLVLLAAVAVMQTARAADPPPKGTVQLSAELEGEQSAGWPVIVEVTVKNSGGAPISWWCGGPDRFPGGQDFEVQVRYGADNDWHTVEPTNGQYVEGSGISETLQPGKSIVVPLAIPVTRADGMHLRIHTKPWDSGEGVEKYVVVRQDRHYREKREAQVIAAVTGQTSPCLQHLADAYADAVVVDALLKLATLDNVPVAAAAARSLAHQKTLPAEAGSALATSVAARMGPAFQRDAGTLCADLTRAALKTQSETARATILHLLTISDAPDLRMILLEPLMVSPGDEAWLRRAKAAVDALPDTTQELTTEKQRVSHWLDARISNPQ